MFGVPQEVLVVLCAFAPLFSKPVWNHARIPAIGAILSTGKRTVTSTVSLALCCAGFSVPVTLVARFRLDASLYDFPLLSNQASEARNLKRAKNNAHFLCRSLCLDQPTFSTSTSLHGPARFGHLVYCGAALR